MTSLSQLRQRISIVAIGAAALAILICLFGHLGAIGLVGPDEPRYAWIARAMARSGDWITPRLWGQPWFEKPVLYYWAAGLGFWLHLPAEWAARLPSSFAALGAALAIGWLGWRHYGFEREAFASPFFTAPLIFSAGIGAIAFSRAAAPDMLFSASIALAMAGAAAVLHKRGALRSAGRPEDEATDASAAGTGDYSALAFFGTSLGLAVLAKGPAGVLLAGGAIGMWALATARWRDAFRLAHPIAIGMFCLVALPWYILCALRNPDFLHIFIFEHNFERYLTPMFQHRQPFWYFIPIAILALLPWTAMLWPTASEGLRLWREKSWSGSPGFFFACWAAFPILFFSFSQSKLPGYILPAVPPLALLVAIGMRRSILTPSIRPASAARWVLASIGITWLVMGLAAMHSVNRLPAGARDVAGKAILHLAILGIVAGVLIAALGLVRSRGTMLLSLFLVFVFVEASGVRVLPALDPYLSARYHGNLLRNDRYPNRVFTFHLQRSWQFGLNFYLEREVPEWRSDDPAAALVLTNPQGFEEIKKLGRFRGELDEPYVGILYVPVLPAPR